MKRSCVRSVIRSVCCLGVILSSSGFAAAQDRVTFVPEGSGGPVVALGEVVENTGRFLILKTLNGSQRIPTESISSIETNYDPAYLRGLQELEQNEVINAQASFREALQREPRTWVQRDIRAWLVKCDLREQDLSKAIREFREITLSDPQTRHWGIAPLIWTPLNVSPSLKAELLPWLTSEREAERMLAASLLLLDPTHGLKAEAQLELLARDPNPVLAAYGKAQLWRLTLAGQKVNDSTLENWAAEIQRLRPELRGGPQYLLSRAFELRGESRRAAAEALWIPYVYSDNEWLAARALADAAGQLERAGQTREAAQLKQELMTRYTWSIEASQVRSSRLQPLEK